MKWRDLINKDDLYGKILKKVLTMISYYCIIFKENWTEVKFMTNTVKLSVFNINKNCLFAFSVFGLKLSLFNNFNIPAHKSFFKKCIISLNFYSIFVFNNLNFRK